MRTLPLLPTVILVLACLLAALLFLLGLAAPGAYFWAAFLLPLLVVFLWGRRRDIYLVGALGGLLVAAGCWSGGSRTPADLLANCVLPLLVLGAAAWLLARYRGQQEQVARRAEELQAGFTTRTAELQASEEKLAKIFRANPGGIAILRQADGYILEVNDAFLNIVGLTREQLVGRSPDDMGVITPAGSAAIREAVQGPGFIHGQDVQIKNAQGAAVDLLFSVEQLDIGGMPCYLVLVLDITERKQYEQLLQDTNALLEQRVAERTADLQRAVDDLQRANRLKDEFMALISHELRTPLTGVLSLSEMLGDQIAGPLNARQAVYVQGITESGNRLLYVINGILSYVHLISGKLPLRAEPCDLANLLNICAVSQQHKAAAKGQAISVHVEPRGLAITSDESALAGILKRLLDNAVKFTPEGGQIGLAAHVGAAPATVDVTVWDTGIGIAQGQIEHILKPFAQADGSLARPYDGLGMGLAYVHEMVNRLGGTLAVESTPGGGSRFTITLPA